jgi:hypothetical protein
MSGSDPWAKTWYLNDADNDKVRQVLLVNKGYSGTPGDGINTFTLQQVYDTNNGNRLIGYRVMYDNNKMAVCWANCYLYIRGDGTYPASCPPSTYPTKPLPPWVRGTSDTDPPPYRDAYQNISHGIVSGNYDHPAIARLEGDIHVGGVPEAVTLWQVDDTRVSGKTFLCIKVRSDNNTVGHRENGIAHGND